MKMNIEDALKKGLIQEVKSDGELVNKELKEAEYDLEKASKTLEEGDYKWSIIQSYYTMFHSARALLFSLRYREKTHTGILIVLEEQRNQGKIQSSYLDDYRAAKNARENADYHYSYSSKKAEYLLEAAREFKEEMERMINKS